MPKAKIAYLMRLESAYTAARETDFSGVRPFKASDRANQRRFSGTVGADNTNDLAPGNFE